MLVPVRFDSLENFVATMFLSHTQNIVPALCCHLCLTYCAPASFLCYDVLISLVAGLNHTNLLQRTIHNFPCMYLYVE